MWLITIWKLNFHWKHSILTNTELEQKNIRALGSESCREAVCTAVRRGQILLIKLGAPGAIVVPDRRLKVAWYKRTPGGVWDTLAVKVNSLLI